MRTPAAAIAWELRQRHRWGLIAVLATILILGAIKIAAPLVPDDVTFPLLVPIPLAATFLYLLAVFTFGISGDLAARESMYPQRMLTLPVSSAALARWPMLFGCVSMALLWLAMRIACIFPSGVAVPKYWPALFAACLLAWTQALTWMPYPFRGMRIVISIGLLVSIDVVVFTALEFKASESTMFLLLAPLVPLAYAAALSAVGRARHGDVPDWGAAKRFAFTRSSARRDFRSAARAQLWFEWRQFGRSLPLLVAIVLPVGLSLLFVFRETPVIVIEIVVASLLLPPFLAIFVAATAGKSSANVSESYGITPFIATRPVNDRALVVTKWQAALLSTFAAWMIVAVAVPAALMRSDATAPILKITRNVDVALGRPRAIVLGLLILAGLVVSTWKQLVQGLYIAMSGREWAVKGIAFATLALLTLGFLALGWILDSRYRIALAVSAIPWLLAAFVPIKLLLAMRVLQRGAARGLFTRTQLIFGAIAWDACVFAVYGVLALILPAILVRRYFLLLVAMLAVPLVRLAAAPLAVARNRHR
ncbi:MAG TPA: hypothetical protein VGQ46_19515 [Thermoanaerobaculia bacterium]|jgi:hypothetical protein|nr:hypothetical protein [Thermoanaerobaculia bacterium]